MYYTTMTAQALREQIARFKWLQGVTTDARACNAIALLAAEAEEQLRHLEGVKRSASHVIWSGLI